MTGNGPDDQRDIDTAKPSAGDSGDALKMFQRVRDRAEPGDREQLFDPSFDTPVGQLSDTDGDWTSNTGFEERPARIGRFEVLDKLGEGGFGTVFLARDPELNRRIALKVPGPGVIVQEELLRRFVREGEAAAALDHPTIVSVYEAGRIGSIHYIASAYVEGEPLSTWLARYDNPLDSVAAAQLVLQLANAVQHAHSRGILHRDLKPANVLLDGSQRNNESPIPPEDLATIARLTDFGLAKQLDTKPSEDDTRTNAILGTPAYMAPEQAEGRNRDVGIASDVYSLGSILYELLTGRPPFKRDSHLATLRAVCNDEPTSPAKIVKSIPTDLEAICLNCLEKNPANRYRNALELGEDLSRFLAGDAVTARPIGRLERIGRWTRRRPLVAALGALSIVLLLALLIGSMIAAIWLNSKNKDIRRHLQAETAAKGEEKIAKKKAQEKTRVALRSEFESLLHQAMLAHQSRRPGQRRDPERLLKRAAAICAELGLGTSEQARIRDEFLNGLDLPDVAVERTGHGWDDGLGVTIDAKASRIAGVESGRLVIRDGVKGKKISETNFGRVRRGTSSIQMSPDARWIAFTKSVSRRLSLNVWDVTANKIVSLENTTGSSVFSPDSRFLATRQAVYNLPDLKRVARVPQSSSVSRVCFSPDGANLAVLGRVKTGRSRSSNRVDIFKVSDMTPVSGFGLRYGQIEDMRWSPDGDRLAFLSNGTLLTVDVRTGKTRLSLFDNSSTIRFDWHPGGRYLVATGDDQRTRLWDTLTGEVALRIDGRFSRFSRDGQWLIGVDGRARFSLPEMTTVLRETTKFQPVASVHPAGRLLVTGENGLLHFRDLQSRRIVARVPLKGMLDASFRFSQDGKWIYLVRHKSIYRMSVQRRETSKVFVYELDQPTRIVAGEFYQMQLARGLISGIVLNGRRSPEAHLADLNAKSTRKLTGTASKLYLAVSADGRLAATSTYGVEHVQLWDLATDRPVRQLGRFRRGRSMQFRPDGRALAACDSRHVTVFDPATGDQLFRTEFQHRARHRPLVAWSSDGEILAHTMDINKIQLRNGKTYSPIAVLSVHRRRTIHALDFSAAGQLLATTYGSGYAIHVWNLGKIRRRLAGLGCDWNPGKQLPPDRASAKPIRIRFDWNGIAAEGG